MTRTMTQQQFNSYLERTGYGVSSETDLNAYVSNKEGQVIAIYWKEAQYIELLEEPLGNEGEWKDTLVSLGYTLGCVVVILFSLFILY